MPAEGSLGIDLAPFARALARETVCGAESDLLRELQRDWRTRTDPAWAAGFARHCPVEGADPSAYTWRRLTDPVVGDVLAGIHFRGLDGAHPFVGVRAWTRSDPALLDDLAGLVAREWAVFRPVSFRLFRASESWAPPGAIVDQHLLAEQVAELRAREAPPGLDRVRVVAGEPKALAARVASLFHAVFERRPALRGRVEPAGESDLAACADSGALFEVEVDGRAAGVVGARKGRRLAWAGAEMVEEVLDPALWGEGLGVALQRRLVDALPATIGPWLWGTIDGANEASLKTAQRVGRRIVGSWWFVPLP